MASYADKGKEVAVASKGLKSLKKGVTSSKSDQKAPPARRYRAKTVEKHGIKWFNSKKIRQVCLENWIDEGHLALKFSTIHDTVRELGLG
ncbi:hypothetical protein HAX54_027595, partial [Datura stramonium]|nr:hypothetical protein [Datura stramonium]